MHEISIGTWGRERQSARAAVFIIPILLAFIGCSGRDKPEFSIVAGGDCLLDRYDGRRDSTQGADVRWSTLRAAAEGSQAFLFNLETTVGEGGTARRKRFVFRAPAEALRPIAGFPRPVAALANNHAMDFGPKGLVATIVSLDQAGIAHAGAGKTRAVATAAVTLRFDGGTVGVLSFGFDEDPSSYAGEGEGGIAPLRLDLMRQAIAADDASSTATIVMLHWGTEYDTRFNGHQQILARELVEAGADLVLGSGPHLIQGIESYKGSLICYSLGNLIFDDLGSEELRTALLIRMRLRSTRRGFEKEFEFALLRTEIADKGPMPLLLSEGRQIAADIASRSPAPGIISPHPQVDAYGLAWYPIRLR